MDRSFSTRWIRLIRSHGGFAHDTSPRGLRLLVLFAVAIVLTQNACGGPSTPSRTARDFGNLIEREAYDAAYHLLASDSRAEVSPEDFARELRQNPSERLALASMLRGEPEAQRAEARFTLADGTVVRFYLEDGEWRLDGSILNPYPQSTPELALRSFSRAVQNKRFDLLIRFVPRRDREGLNEQVFREAFEDGPDPALARLFAIVDETDSFKAQIEDDRAVIQYASDGLVFLVFEDSVWKIADLR